jgi:hypothetical protein
LEHRRLKKNPVSFVGEKPGFLRKDFLVARRLNKNPVSFVGVHLGEKPGFLRKDFLVARRLNKNPVSFVGVGLFFLMATVQIVLQSW